MGHFVVFTRRPESYIYDCNFFVTFSSTKLASFFMHNKYVLIFLLTFIWFRFSPFVLNTPLQRQKFYVLWKEKIHNTKTTEWHNELKPTKNELKINICLLRLYLNDYNESKLTFWRTLRKLFWFAFLFSLA